MIRTTFEGILTPILEDKLQNSHRISDIKSTQSNKIHSSDTANTVQVFFVSSFTALYPSTTYADGSEENVPP